MIARNPKNHQDQWYIAPEYFAKHYRLANATVHAVETSGWQPIETAPREGAHVLVVDDGQVSEARHIEGDGWYLAQNDPSDSWGPGPLNPTHWMPLPCPPGTRPPPSSSVEPSEDSSRVKRNIGVSPVRAAARQQLAPEKASACTCRCHSSAGTGEGQCIYCGHTTRERGR